MHFEEAMNSAGILICSSLMFCFIADCCKVVWQVLISAVLLQTYIFYAVWTHFSILIKSFIAILILIAIYGESHPLSDPIPDAPNTMWLFSDTREEVLFIHL